MLDGMQDSYLSDVRFIIQDVEVRQATTRELSVDPNLWYRHLDEIGNIAGVDIDEDMQHFEAMEAAGCFIGIGAWCEGKLVGYSLNSVIQRHPIYNEKWMTHLALFVDKPYRRGKIGRMLIDETERLARANACKRMTMHAKPYTQLEQWLPRLGYQPLETVFIKDF
jgi:GNAT superfamily N-acetyltransferase